MHPHHPIFSMSPKRSSSRPQQPAQRRPRRERACNFCRIAKQRCEPIEYGTNDQPCRRCVSQGLDCNIPQAARSQSPSSGPSVQGPGPIRHHIAPHSASGPTEELTPGSETSVQYTLQQHEPARFPMGRCSPPMIRSEERQGSSATILAPGQTPLGTSSFSPLAPTMEGYQQSFPNVAQGPTNLEPSYYQDYYGQTMPVNSASLITLVHGAPRPCNPYIPGHATRSASDGEPNLGYTAEEPQPCNDGASASEQDASLFR